MEFLVECILELIGGMLGEGAKSPNAPKAVRTVLTVLLFLPVLIGSTVLGISFLHDSNAGAAVFCFAVNVLYLVWLTFVLRRIWKA